MYVSAGFLHVYRHRQPSKETTREGAYKFVVSSSGLPFILCIIFLLFTLVSAHADQPNFLYEYCQNDKGNDTTNSTTYQFVSNRLSNIIPSSNGNMDKQSFYNFSYGQISDQMYETGLCRGDIEPGVCRSCLNHSAQILALICPDKEAIGGFNECVLRFSNRSVFGLMVTHPRFYMWNTQKVASIYMNFFLRELRTLLDDLKSRASAGGALRKYATGNKQITAGGFRTIFALVQCTPDLSRLGCRSCLDEAFGDIPRHYVRIGGRVVTPSCNFRYEVYLFYGQSPYDAPPATPLSPPLVLSSDSASTQDLNITGGIQTAADRYLIEEEAERKSGERRRARYQRSERNSSWQQAMQAQRKGRNRFGTDLVIVLSTVASVVLVFIGIYSRVKKANKRVENLPSPEAAEEIGCTKCLRFDFSTIRFATNNFSEENKIGRSMVGLVYRGRLRDGRNISVKKFHEHDSYRDCFKNEVKLSAKLQHRNLVKLLGFCLEGSERLLVYEFVPIRLDLLIFDPFKVKNIYLDWDRRSNIIRGIARGLLYLHEDSGLTIIHRNIGASKILLDTELNPKILGFGRAKLCGVDQIEDASTFPHVSTSLKGYVAPEFFKGGLISVKADVFSFGVLLLEIVTGQRSCRPLLCHVNPDEEPTLISIVWRNWMEGTASDLVDPQIKEGNESKIMRFIHIGLLCVQENEDARPTVNSVLLMLNCYCFSLPIPSRPGFFRETSTRNELHRSSSSDLNSGVIGSSDDHLKSEVLEGCSSEPCAN